MEANEAEFGVYFTGRDLDQATNLYDYRARWYDAATTQFLTPDPLGFAAGDANTYRYVGNDPANFTDPSGMEGEPSRRDSRGLGVNAPWTIDGRPWEPSAADVADMRAATSRGFWSEAWATLFPSFYVDYQEVMDRVTGDARTYRRMMEFADPVSSRPDSKEAYDRTRTEVSRQRSAHEFQEGMVTLDAAATLTTLGASGLQSLSRKKLWQSVADDMIVASSQKLPNLEILNPSYTPNGSRLLQNLTNQVNQELSGNLPLALTVLSDAEVAAAASSSGLARAQYGNALERLVGRQIKADPILNDLFKHVGRPNNPDFVGKGLLKGMNFDITTPTQIDVHLARPRYGKGLNVITYERPVGFP